MSLTLYASFMRKGKLPVLRTFLLTYGYAEAEINEQLSHRLMAYTLLHRYRPLNWIRETFVKQSCLTIEELAQAIYALR
jgi:hygromycin-B 7''-O-kinase